MTPSTFKPAAASEFVGIARTHATTLLHKCRKLAASKTGGNAKFLFHGQPGTGKSSLAQLVANALAGDPLNIEHINGASCNAETIRDWRRSSPVRSVFGGFSVKFIDEVDLCTVKAQDEMLTYLDGLPDYVAVVVTCNSQLGQLSERFRTRFQTFSFESVPDEEIVRLLVERFGLDDEAAAGIAVAHSGNVRGALLAAESYLDTLEALQAEEEAA